MPSLQKTLSNSKKKSIQAKNLSRMPEKTQQSRINRTWSVAITTFKSSADSVTVIIGNFNFSIMPHSYQRWLSPRKKLCSRLNAPTAAKLQWFPSNPQRANPLTVKRAFQNTYLHRQKVAAKQTFSTPNKRGHGEEKPRKETKQLTSRLYSNGLIAHKTKKLFRKNETRNEVVADLHRTVDSRKFFSGLIQLLLLMPNQVLLSWIWL